MRHIHRLNTNSAWTGKTVPEQVSRAGEEPGLKALEHGFHADCPVLVNPSARLHVYLFAWLQHDLEYVAKSMQPEQPLSAHTGERVDKEANAAKKNVRRALVPIEGEIHIIG